VSSLSSTMIGHGQSEAHRHAVAQSHYRNEASKISEHISGLHPSRRQKIMQVQYPTTVSRLSCGPSSGISATHSQQQQSSLSNHDSNSALRASTLRKGETPHFFCCCPDHCSSLYCFFSSVTAVESEKQFHERRSVELREEYSLNDRKKRFNRSCGTHAVVSDVGSHSPLFLLLSPSLLRSCMVMAQGRWSRSRCFLRKQTISRRS
jgi:hypothetical protein